MATSNLSPSVLSAETVREYILSKGGKVYNTELVKYFKPLLTHPDHKNVAREEFKRIINNIAIVFRDEKDEKYLILKKPNTSENSTLVSLESTLDHPLSFQTLNSTVSLSASIDSLSSFQSAGSKQPPPYRSPPPVYGFGGMSTLNSCPSNSSSESLLHDCTPPPVPPRRRSSDKIKFSNKENDSDSNSQRSSISSSLNDSENKMVEIEQKISVKERTQRFNRLASFEGPSPSPPKTQQCISTGSPYRKRFEKSALSDRDEEDCVSVASFDPRSREWLVRAAQGNYQALAKMCAENSKLAKTKDPASGYTALHWGAKHGNLDIIKLIAGSCRIDPNNRSNGGYTPLHIAAQFNRDDVFELLTKVYGADPNLRDWSGRKPNQYRNMTNPNSFLKTDSIRTGKSQKKNTDKDNSFLRIGSLNVRVKRTTEAVSNFLGVSQSNLDKAHKTWGSADSIQDCKRMPPPKFGPPKKRKSKHLKETSSARSSLIISESRTEEKSDSDSDTAFGFDSHWKQQYL